MSKQKPSVTIRSTNAGQIVVGSENVSQSVKGDLNVTGGIDLASLLAVLREIRREIDSAGADPAAKEEALDAVVNAEREASDPKPDSRTPEQIARRPERPTRTDWDRRGRVAASAGMVKDAL